MIFTKKKCTENGKLPNFLIVGAAKSGTTAIVQYLQQHPEIFFCPIKEPKFISAQFVCFPLQGNGDDFIEAFTIKDFELYKKLFFRVNGEKAIGEASVENLYYYKQAIPVIKEYLGDVKIIIILRNPITRAFSAFKNMVRDSREELTFEEALDQEGNRKRDNWEFIWFYKDVGFYYNQVKAYLDNFSRVKIFLFDDFQKDTIEFLKSIFEFLEVDNGFIPDVKTKFNVSGVPVNTFLKRFLKPTQLKGRLYKFLTMNGVSEYTIRSFVEKMRTNNIKTISMKQETKSYLKDLYYHDIIKLQDLINRDLTTWLT